MDALTILSSIVLMAVAVFFGYKFRDRWDALFPLNKNRGYATMLSVLPPIRLMLGKSTPAQWCRRDQFDRYEQTLRKAGFTHGEYLATEHGQLTVQLSLWHHPNSGLMCTIIESVKSITETKKKGANDARFYVELGVRFSDGSTLVATTNSSAGLLPRPVQHLQIKCEKDDLHALFAVLKERLPKNKKIQPVNDVKSVFIAQCEQYSEWLWREGQLRSSQMRAAAEKLNVKFTEDMIEQLLELAGYELSERYTQRILTQFEYHNKMDAANWERYREKLVVVHELMRPAEVISCVYELVPQVKEQFEEELEAFSELSSTGEPVKAFHHFLKKASAGQAAKRVARLENPINAEIYLAG
jgi:hypothetical protein